MDTRPAAPEAPEALAWSTENCPISLTMTLFGERWTLVVVREVFNGVRRFEDIRARTGIPRQVLTERLRLLVEAGILDKVPYRVDGQRPRHEYRLTPRGQDLQPILVAVATWGTRHLAGPEGPAVRFIHRDCGAEVGVQLTCTAGHELPTAREVVPQPGPGAIRRAPA